MTDVLDGVHDHYRATGPTGQLKTALMALGPEDQQVARQRVPQTRSDITTMPRARPFSVSTYSS